MAKSISPVQVQLAPQDLDRINQLLAACAAGDAECQRALAAGLPADEVRQVYSQLRDQLQQLKRAYFPGQP